VNDEKRARLVKVPLYRRLDRAQSKVKWYRKMSLLMDKYCLEYTQLLNVTLDKTYRYNA